MERAIISVPTLSNKENITNGSLASALVLKAFKEATFIPNNATNGDVMKAVFPNAEITEEKYYDGTISHYTVCFVGEGGRAIYNIFLDSWWNAPYKKEGEQK